MSDKALLDDLLDPFDLCFSDESAQRVTEFELSSRVQEYAKELATSADDGSLSAVERADYEALIDVTDLIAILKLKAQRQLADG